MRINKLNQSDVTYFRANMRFIPVTNRKEAKEVAKILADSKEENFNGSFLYFYKLIKPFEVATDTFMFSESVNRGLPHHITIVKNGDSVLGAYSIEYDTSAPQKGASIDFIVDSSSIRHTKAAKRFFANAAENIYKTLAKHQIRTVNCEKCNPDISSLFKSASNKQINTLDIEELKKNIDDYKRKELLL